MINQKSVIIGFIISIILSLLLGFVTSIGSFIAVFLGGMAAVYLASNEIRLKVVEAGLYGILVGIFTGIAQILIIYARTGFSQKVAGILIIASLVLIGGFIIVGALGGIIGLLLSVKTGHMGEDEEEIAESAEPNKPKKEIEKSEKND